MISSVAVVVVVVASLALMLVRPRGIAEVWWITLGAGVLVGTRLVGISRALHAVAKGADVFAFLTGMMLLSELAREHGVFDWISSVALSRARGSSMRLFATIYLFAVVVTMFLSNDATAVVLTPAIAFAVRRARVAALPHLYACALVANAASFVLPISNPANLVVFAGSLPSLGSWLAWFFLPSLLAIGATFVVLRWMFRRELGERFEAPPEGPALGVRGRWVLAGLVLVALLLIGASARNAELGVPTLACALGVVLAASLATRRSPLRPFAAVSWSTLVLVAGLFVLVEAVQAIGAVELAASALGWAARRGAWGAVTTSFLVGTLNNLVNNLPLGLITGATVAHARPPPLLAHALLIAVDLGPNLAVTGSLATMLWLIALRKEKVDVGFADFLRVGAVAMPAALGMAMLGLLCAHWILP